MAASKDNLQHIWIALHVDQVDPHGQEIPSGEESPALRINSLQHAETNAEWKWGGHNIFRNLLQKPKHKLETRLPGEMSITSDMQMTPPAWQKMKKS